MEVVILHFPECQPLFCVRQVIQNKTKAGVSGELHPFGRHHAAVFSPHETDMSHKGRDKYVKLTRLREIPRMHAIQKNAALAASELQLGSVCLGHRQRR